MDMFSSTTEVQKKQLYLILTSVTFFSTKIFFCLYAFPLSILYSITGQEYPAVVEFAPFQKTAKKRSKKKDAKCGTIVEGKFSMLQHGIHDIFFNIFL